MTVAKATKLKNKTKSKSTSEVKNFDVTFSKEELAFLRDIFGLLMVSETSVTEYFATKMDLEKIEASTWQKIADTCKTAKIAVGKNAPNYILHHEIYEFKYDEEDTQS